MVIQSGIIIPFQFRDVKKLLMVGVPEDNRALSVYDLKNVVRAAFGVYNFEFRNKKIDFTIPEDLLMPYLDQKRDLSNFVIEIGQVIPTVLSNDRKSTIDAQQHLNVPFSKNSNGGNISNGGVMPSPSNTSTVSSGLGNCVMMGQPSVIESRGEFSPRLVNRPTNQTPVDVDINGGFEGSNHHSLNMENVDKQLEVDPLLVVPKSETDDEMSDCSDMQYSRTIHAMEQFQHNFQQQEHDQQLLGPRIVESAVQLRCPEFNDHEMIPQQPILDQHYNLQNMQKHQFQKQHDFQKHCLDQQRLEKQHLQRYMIDQHQQEQHQHQLQQHPHPHQHQHQHHHQQQSQLDSHQLRSTPEFLSQQQPQSQSQPPAPTAFRSNFVPNMQNNIESPILNSQPAVSIVQQRLRRRGERMSKDQKEVYVNFLQENLCMLTQRRNDTTLEPLWNKLTTLLNSIPQGAIKNVEEWKQTFDAWRYRIFMYTRYNSKLSGTAANNPKNFKPLTSTDQRAYTIWTSNKSSAPHEMDKIYSHSDEDRTQDYDN